MGVDLEVMVTSQKKRVTLPSGETVIVYGYRTCGRCERDSSDRIIDHASKGVDDHNPRFIVSLGFGEVNDKGSRVFEWVEGLLVYRVDQDKSCRAAWLDTSSPPNTKPLGFLKKQGRSWILVTRFEQKVSGTSISKGLAFSYNRMIEYIEDGKFRSLYCWKDESTASPQLAPC